MPATSTNDLKLLLRKYLSSNAGVGALVGKNVFGIHLEDADAGTVLTDSPMVVFELLSGVLRWHGAVSIQTMDIYGYSKRSADEAGQVYDAITVALQHECVKVTGVDVSAVCRETQRPLDGYNHKIDAWFLRGRWTMEVT